jgi:hypothetical protein
MRVIHILVALLGGVAPAQGVSVSVAAGSPVGVIATVGSQTAHDSVPAGTAIGRYPQNLDLAARIQTPEYASSVTLSYPQPAGSSIAILHRSYARGATTTQAGTSGSAAPTGASQGACSFLVTVSGAPGTTGDLVLSWHGSADAGCRMNGGLDVGDDGSIEWTGGAGNLGHRARVTLGSQPLVARVTLDGQAVGTGSSADFVDVFADCFVRFEADQTSSCNFSIYGQSCGPVLTGSAQTTNGRHLLTMSLAGGFPNAQVLAIAGDQRLALPLGLQCLLLSNVEYAQVLGTNGAGVAQDVHSIPSTATGTLFFQMLPIDVQGGQLVLRATNGVQLDCVR